jgi:hypothetical protein
MFNVFHLFGEEVLLVIFLFLYNNLHSDKILLVSGSSGHDGGDDSGNDDGNMGSDNGRYISSCVSKLSFTY